MRDLLLPRQVRAGLKGNRKEAISYFKLALANNVYDFIEHRYALLELELMAQAPATRSPGQERQSVTKRV